MASASTPKDKLDLISELYYEQGNSVQQVAETVGYSHGKVTGILKKHLKGTRTPKEIGAKNGERLRGTKVAPDKVENMRKGWLRSRTTDEYKAKIAREKIGEKNPSAVLTSDIVIEIRKQYNDMLETGSKKTESQRYLGKEYGVSRSCVSDIVGRRTWKHI